MLDEALAAKCERIEELEDGKVVMAAEVSLVLEELRYSQQALQATKERLALVEVEHRDSREQAIRSVESTKGIAEALLSDWQLLVEELEESENHVQTLKAQAQVTTDSHWLMVGSLLTDFASTRY